MTKSTTTIGPLQYVGFHAQRTAHVKPVIKKEYYQEGVRMYLSDDNRHFLADVVDKMFNCAKMAIKSKRYKGANASKRVAALR